MNHQSSSKTPIIVFIVILLIGIAIYFYTLGDPNTSSISSLDSQSNEDMTNTQAEGANVLMLLNQVNSLKIDATIFNGAVYQSLVDYTVEVPEQPVGRPNPFTPFYTPMAVPTNNRTR